MKTILSLLSHTPLLGMVLGPFITIIGDYIHDAWSWLGNQKPIVKQAFAVVLAFVLIGLTQLIPGFAAPQSCAATLASGISAVCQNDLTSLFTDPTFWTKVATAALTAVAVKHGQQNAAPQPPKAS